MLKHYVKSERWRQTKQQLEAIEKIIINIFCDKSKLLHMQGKY